jgi:hypothetical protein
MIQTDSKCPVPVVKREVCELGVRTEKMIRKKEHSPCMAAMGQGR